MHSHLNTCRYWMDWSLWADVPPGAPVFVLTAAGPGRLAADGTVTLLPAATPNGPPGAAELQHGAALLYDAWPADWPVQTVVDRSASWARALPQGAYAIVKRTDFSLHHRLGTTHPLREALRATTARRHRRLMTRLLRVLLREGWRAQQVLYLCPARRSLFTSDTLPPLLDHLGGIPRTGTLPAHALACLRRALRSNRQAAHWPFQLELLRKEHDDH